MLVAVDKKIQKNKKKRNVFFLSFYWMLVAVLWLSIMFAGYIGYILLSMPQISSWQIPTKSPNIHIVDRYGDLIAHRGSRGSEAVPYEAISPWIIKAVIAIEDRRFYHHTGIDTRGLLRALMINLQHRQERQGASTLTQQLAKNLFLSSQRTFDRKIREAILAYWLEYRLTKHQILELYLNRVYFGAGSYGIAAATRRYFNKTADKVTIFEAALLAGMLKAPTKLSPIYDPQAAHDRALLVLEAMYQETMIDAVTYQEAKNTKIRKIPLPGPETENYVADYVIQQLPYLIGEVDRDLFIETSLDLSLQREAEKNIQAQIELFGKKRQVTQGALVSIEANGALRAMVGGVHYAKSQYNRAIEAKRQPGSAFKPFVYLAALEQGKSPNSLRNDMPIKIGRWKPRNVNNKYMGSVTLATALAYSLNSVAAQLIMETGPEAVIEVAHRLGIHSGLSDNASIALGTSEVSLFELTSAFIPFANGGYKPQIYLIRRILDADTKQELYNIGKNSAISVLKPQIVGMMNAMLAQTMISGTAKGGNIGRQTAGKTGTSQNFRDAWFIGYSAHYSTGVWFGNDNGQPMERIGGSSLPVEVWKNYMMAAEKGKPIQMLPGNFILKNIISGGNDL